MDLENVEELGIICGICGNSHKFSQCNIVTMKSHIQDNIVPSKARLTLPNVLRIEKMSEGSDVVVAAENVKKGTQFGPFHAKKLFTLNPEIIFPLKLFMPNDYFSEYYLDSSNEEECNWMMFVPPANNVEEQNLICYQDGLQIFYMSIRDIAVGEFLKVWYSSFYAQKMNRNVLVSYKEPTTKVLDLNTLLKKQQNLMERDIWTCKFCNIQEKDVTRFATHISQHYSMQVRKACEICKSVFMTHKGLKKHIRIVHPNKSIVQCKDQEENVKPPKRKGSVTKDSMLGGPLLNDVLTDSMDNTNLLLQQADISRFDMQNIESNDMLLDSDNLNLAVENFIRDADNFNFNIDEDKEEHVCDICLKPFSKLKRLVQHLQKHTGKYTCPECLVIFSRNENLQAHKCNIHNKQQYECLMCSKQFALKKYLSRHEQSVHQQKRPCPKCNKSYHCDKEFKEHNCSGVLDVEKVKFPCLICDKTFFRESYTKRHMKLHAPIKETPTHKKIFICEICAKTFRTTRNLRRHKKAHCQLSYSCSECDKTYSRVDTLNHHVVLEHSSNIYTCPVCEKSCKSKRYLKLHMSTHSIRKKHPCTVCDQKFFGRSNLLRHMKTKHAIQCSRCNEEDCSHIKTIVECYECPICQKLVKLRSSIIRHLRNTHPKEQVDTGKIKKIRKLWYTSETQNKTDTQITERNINTRGRKMSAQERPKEVKSRKLQKIAENRDNLVQKLDKIEIKSNENETANKESNDNVLDFNNLSLEMNSNLAVNNQEICLSMPELTEMDQDVTLSDNAYVLENGTIVEPLDSENVVVYIFDKK